MKSKLDLGLIAELNSTFEEKEWSNIYHYDIFFERYCSFLENLDDNELKLVIELTSHYEWITDNQYLGLLIQALEKLNLYEDINLDKIFILPLLSRSDRLKNKDKSSRHVAYLCNNVQIKYNPIFSNTSFQLIDNLQHLPKESKIHANKHPIILVDDYVGTGETASEAIEELFEIREYDKRLVFILTLVTQERGLKVMEEKELNVLYGILKKRGITDQYDDNDDKNDKLSTMNALENKLAIDDDYRLGYKGSEALITMIRTPNNTFPIYWHEAKLSNGKEWIAPFPRK